MFTLRTLTTIGLVLVLAAGASAADKHGSPGRTHAKPSPQAKAVHLGQQLQFRGLPSAARGTPRTANGLVWNETGEVGSRGFTSSGPTVRGMVIMPDPGLKAGSPKFGPNRPNLMSRFNQAETLASNIMKAVPMPK
jgi:hypothetical protein